MPSDRPPVCFKDYTRQKPGKGSARPPVSIDADDLDRNFTWAGLIVDESTPDGFATAPFIVKEGVVNGHKQRKLSFANPFITVPTFGIIDGVSKTFDSLTPAEPESV